MAKNRFSSQPKQQTPAMSPSHPNTVGGVVNPLSPDDDEDNDICPVCDGECTCDNRPRQPPPRSSPSSKFNGNARNAVPNSSPSISVASPVVLGPLKIKLTVPAGMLGKRRIPAANPKKPKNLEGTTYVVENNGEASSSSYPVSTTSQPSHSFGPQDSTPPKRRGRPPKTIVATREGAAKATIESPVASTFHVSSQLPSYPQSQSLPSHKRCEALPHQAGKPKTKAAARPPTKLKAKGTIVKKPIVSKKKRHVVSSESSDLSDVDPRYDFDDEDAKSGQFPTFVSASAMSASTSSNGSDGVSLSGFDTDSSIEAEEENFILTEEQRAHNKARVRRELLGDEGVQKRRDSNNNWVIRPRKKSVGLSDVDMDVDSDDDATEDDDDEDDEEDEADEEDADDDAPGVGYAGVATGWSEDDESSFDAELFFANLSDSTGKRELSSSDDETDNEDPSDLDAMSLAEAAAAGLIPHLRRELENLPFEVTEGWDGQIVFTNGLREGQGILDMDFEASAAQMVAETSASPSQESDIDMSDLADGEYEEDEDFDLQESDGETTEEELVGDDGLPTARAMKLFRLPSSVSAINPMSTMSPTASPGPGNRKRNGESPKPADILAGKVFWDSDEHDECENSAYRTRSLASVKGGLPCMGQFEPGEVDPKKRAIIDGSSQHVPSPFPRSRRGRSISRLGPARGMRYRTHGISLSQSSSLAGSMQSSLHLMSSEETPTSPELPPTEPFNLDDVLDSSFLDCEPMADAPTSSSLSSEGDGRRHMKNLSRWDLISVGAFRQTRETASLVDSTASWSVDTPRVTTSDSYTYGNMMKSSPLSTMLWQNKSTTNPPKLSPWAPSMGVVISPVLSPVRERDGERTPTNIPYHYQQVPPPQQNNNYPHKSRKELRREKKLKRKSSGAVHHQHQHYQHHARNHHPNMKSRSSSAVQRTNFFNSTSSVPPLNL